MPNKKTRPQPRTNAGARTEAAAPQSTLKDLLSADTLQKLKERAESIKAEERELAEAKRAAEEAARKAEEKRLAGDFGHLLDNSSLDWKSFK